jgi:hypothetical protein
MADLVGVNRQNQALPSSLGNPLPSPQGNPLNESQNLNPLLPPGLPGDWGGQLPGQIDGPALKKPLAPTPGSEADSLQSIAKGELRVSGETTATDVLLGLHLQPTVCGMFPPPPGNAEALRFLTPPTRRSILRALLLKQRARTRRLGAFFHPEFEEERESSSSKEQARRKLAAATGMLDLLDDLLEMQDYTLSQIGMFSKG